MPSCSRFAMAPQLECRDYLESAKICPIPQLPFLNTMMRYLACTILLFSIPFFADFAHAQTDKQREMMKRQQKQAQLQQVMMRLSSIMHNPALRDELDIVEDQVKELQQISQDFQKEIQTFNAAHSKKIMEVQELFRSGEQQKAMEMSTEFQRQMFEISEKHFKIVEKKLLPHQIKRIQQISKQEVLKYMSPFKDEFGIPFAIAEDLGLSPNEKKKLKETIEKAREKYYAKVLELKEKTHAEILKSIPADKREQVKEILGEIYDKVQTQRLSQKANRESK